MPLARIKLAILIVLVSLAHGACAKLVDSFRGVEKKDGYTRVKFGGHEAGRGLNAMAVLNGGVMIYALNQFDQKAIARFVPTDDNALVLTLPNGSWSFIAVGWTTAGFTGTEHCGLGADAAGGAPGQAVNLDGQDKTVILTMAQANCTASNGGIPLFADAEFMTGSSFLPIHTVFCGADEDVTGAINSDDCAPQPSAFFVKGNSGVTITETNATEDRKKIFYVTTNFTAPDSSDEHLFMVPTQGGLPIRLTPASSHGNLTVKDFEFTESGDIAFIICDPDTDEEFELFAVNTGDPGSFVRISADMPATGDVIDAVVSNSQNRVVYAADPNTDGFNELFSVNFDGSGLVNLTSGASLQDGGVALDSSSDPVFEINNAGTIVVFVGDKTSNASIDDLQMHSVNINGSGLVDMQASGYTGGTTPDRIHISQDDTRVIWGADLNSDGTTVIYSFQIGVANSETQCTAISPDGFAIQFVRVFEDDETDQPNSTPTNKVLFSRDNSGPKDLYVMNPDCSGGIQLSNLGGTDFVQDVLFTPDGASVVYVADISGVRKIFSNNLGGNTNNVNDFLLMDTVIGSGVRNSGSGPFPFQVTRDSNNVVYIAAEDSANFDLYVSVLNTTGGSALLHTGNGAGEDVLAFGLSHNDANQVIYASDAGETNGNYVLFHTTISAKTETKVSPTPVGGTGISEVHFVDSGAANAVFAVGSVLSAAQEVFIKDISDLSQNLIRTGPTFDATGLGRYRLVSLAYDADAVGNNFLEFPAIRTGCINPVDDGEQTDTGAKFPFGTLSGFSPFAIKVEIFPLASDCNGSPIEYIFSEGFAQKSFNNFGANIAEFDSDLSTKVVLFLRDPF